MYINIHILIMILLEIADVLGHKKISVTKLYAHLCIEHKSSLINRVMGGIYFQNNLQLDL